MDPGHDVVVELLEKVDWMCVYRDPGSLAGRSFGRLFPILCGIPCENFTVSASPDRPLT